jgi:hypothetical protein
MRIAIPAVVWMQSIAQATDNSISDYRACLHQSESDGAAYPFAVRRTYHKHHRHTDGRHHGPNDSHHHRPHDRSHHHKQNKHTKYEAEENYEGDDENEQPRALIYYSHDYLNGLFIASGNNCETFLQKLEESRPNIVIDPPALQDEQEEGSSSASDSDSSDSGPSSPDGEEKINQIEVIET